MIITNLKNESIIDKVQKNSNWGSILGCVIAKTQKMVLDVHLLDVI